MPLLVQKPEPPHIEIITSYGILALGSGSVTARSDGWSGTFDTLLDAVKAVQSMYPDTPRLRFSVITERASSATINDDVALLEAGPSFPELLRAAAAKF